MRIRSTPLALALTLVVVASSAALAQAAPKPGAPVTPAAPATPAPTAGSGKTEVTWWGHAAFIVKTPGGAVIAIDPWLQNPIAPKGAAMPTVLDAILVTHGHSDHVGNTADLAKKTGAQVIGAYELTGLIGAQNSAGGNMGGTIVVKDATIHMVPAMHSSGYGDKPPLAYGGPAMGFVVEIKGGPTLYHAGDTDVFSEMSLIADRYKPTIAMLPIGGQFTMDPAGAALAAKMLKVKTVVPMHFGTFPALAGTPDALRTALKKAAPSVKVLELKPGELQTF